MAEWHDWIGRTSSSVAQLHAEQANLLALTLDRESHFQRGDLLPPGWHWLYFHERVKSADLGVEGHPRLGIVMPPIPLPRRMWAGGALAFYAPLRLGDVVERTTLIRSITPKEGRSGPLWFVNVEHTLRTAGVVNLVEEQTIVYRAAATATATTPAPVAPVAAYAQHYTLSSAILFRYSALTFNAHRIHYDADYCRDVEGYPGLVIHGPLIATLLLDLHARQGAPATFMRYRAQHPLFLPHTFTVAGRREGDTARLWALSHTGEVAMDAAIK